MTQNNMNNLTDSEIKKVIKYYYKVTNPSKSSDHEIPKFMKLLKYRLIDFQECQLHGIIMCCNYLSYYKTKNKIKDINAFNNYMMDDEKYEKFSKNFMKAWNKCIRTGDNNNIYQNLNYEKFTEIFNAFIEGKEQIIKRRPFINRQNKLKKLIATAEQS